MFHTTEYIPAERKKPVVRGERAKMWDLKRCILTHGVEQSAQKVQTKYKKDLYIKVGIVWMCLSVCV